MRTIQILLTLFVGVGAVAGAAMMWIDPSGATWGGGPLLAMLQGKMPWPEVFFHDFVPSGFVLLALNGLPQVAAAVLLFKRHRLAPWVVLACGIVLMLWIVLEWWVWGFNAMSNAFFGLGLAEVLFASMALAKQKRV